MKKIFYILTLSLGFGCGSNHDASFNNENTANEYQNGTFCADIDFYNPKTGTSNTYSLNVDVNDGYVVKIHWPNGGWLDEDHFDSEKLSEDNKCDFTSDRGYKYSIEIKGEECSESPAQMPLMTCANALRLTEEELSEIETVYNINRNAFITDKVCEMIFEYFQEIRKLKSEHQRARDSMQNEMNVLNTKIENGYIQNVYAFYAHDKVTCQLVIVKKRGSFYMLQVYSSEKCEMGVMDFDHRNYDMQTITVQENPSIKRYKAYSAQIVAQSNSYQELDSQHVNYCSF